MPKKRAHPVQLTKTDSTLVGRISMSALDRKIRKTGTRAGQLMKSRKAYDRNRRKREDVE